MESASRHLRQHDIRKPLSLVARSHGLKLQDLWRRGMAMLYGTILAYLDHSYGCVLGGAPSSWYSLCRGGGNSYILVANPKCQFAGCCCWQPYHCTRLFERPAS